MTGRSIVAGREVPSRSLVGIVAILAFLAALATGLAGAVAAKAVAWRSAVVAEATIQVRPRGGRDLDADVARAAAIARATPGITRADILPARDGQALLEPWLGGGLDLSALPVPRLVALGLGRDPAPDLAALSARLRQEVPGAELDDHGRWLSRLSTGATAVAGGALSFALLLTAASGVAVGFAARGVAAANRDTVAILGLIGAESRFIARAVARHFVLVGGAGAAAGLAGALAVGATALSAFRDLDTNALGPVSLTAITIAMTLVAGAIAGLSVLVPLRTVQAFVDHDARGERSLGVWPRRRIATPDAPAQDGGMSEER